VPGADHHLVDAVEDLGGEQAQVLLERLQAALSRCHFTS
jgi:hypothetical protein